MSKDHNESAVMLISVYVTKNLLVCFFFQRSVASCLWPNISETLWQKIFTWRWWL